MVLLITQNIHVKILKYPQIKSFFFIFSQTKSVIFYTWKLEKPKIPLSNGPLFFDLRSKEVFLLL
jgi:hypothetical protein